MNGFQFETKSDPFAVMNFVYAVAVVMFDIIQGNISIKRALTIYTLLVMVLGVVMCGITYFFKFK